MIHYKQLRAFVTIIEQGSFSKAAKLLYITQPAISLQIKTLETDLGLTLIERGDREITLTPAGKSFYENAKIILNQYSTLEEDLNVFRKEAASNLRIAASTIPGEYLMPKYIKGFQIHHPDLTINMDIHDSTDVLNMVLNDEISMGIIGFACTSSDIHCEPFVNERLKLVGPVDSNYWQTQSKLIKEIQPNDMQLHLKTLISMPHILREEGSGTRKVVLDYLKTYGITYSQINLSTSLGSTKSTLTAVEVGLGLSWISEHALDDALKLNKVKIIHDAFDINRTFFVITRKKKTLNPMTQAFKAYLLEDIIYLE